MLDKRSIDDATALLVSVDPEEDTQVLNHRCEFRITLDLLIGFEMRGIGIDSEDARADWVFTYEAFMKVMGAS